MMNLRRCGALCASAAVVLSLVGCGDDDESATEPVPAGVTDTAGSSSEEIEVELVDFQFNGLPDTIPVGTTITVVNNAPSELHEIVVFRLPDDEDRSIHDLMELPEEELGAALGGPPVMVLLAAPGGPQVAAVGDGTFTEPGRYVYVCAIPTGTDPDEYLAAAEAEGDGPPEVAGGPPHFVHGMHGEVVVE